MAGIIYDNGLGVPHNYDLACRLFEKAGEQGEIAAIRNLGKFVYCIILLYVCNSYDFFNISVFIICDAGLLYLHGRPLHTGLSKNNVSSSKFTSFGDIVSAASLMSAAVLPPVIPLVAPGSIVAPNRMRALALYDRAADLGDPEARRMLEAELSPAVHYAFLNPKIFTQCFHVFIMFSYQLWSLWEHALRCEPESEFQLAVRFERGVAGACMSLK